MVELIAGAAVGVAAFMSVAAHLKMRGQLSQANALVADTLNKALAAERDKAKAEAELTFLQQSIVTMMQRPVVASLTDDHVHHIGQTLSQLMMSYLTPKEKQN